MAEQECGNCRYCRKAPALMSDDLECRINPPTIEGWPNVLVEDWCAQYMEDDDD